ncbi:MAG TPA: polysaccharide biosynthesis tyrosine autokinase [Gemmatimonadaceae bacterium]
MNEHENLPAPHGASPPAVPSWNGASMAPPEDEAGGGLNLGRYKQALLRRKWLILLLAAAGTAGGAYASRFVEMKYRAQTTVLLGSMSRQDASQGPIQTSDLLGGTDWLSLLNSYEVLDYVAWHERLYLKHAAKDRSVLSTFSLDSTFAPGSYQLRVSRNGRQVELLTAEGVQLEVRRPGEPIGVSRGFVWRPDRSELTAGRVIEFRVTTAREAAGSLRGQLGTSLPKGSSFIAISYTANSPQVAASVVNTAVDRFIEAATALKNAKVVELRDLLEEQLHRAETNLMIADQALQQYRARTITLPREGSALPMTPGLAETTGPITSAYWSLKMQQDALEQDRQRVVAALQGARRDSLSVDAFTLIPSAQQSPELRQALDALATERAGIRALRQSFTDEHAQVQQARARIDELEDKAIPELAGRVIQNIDAQTANLERLIGAAGSEMEDIPVRVAEEWKLKREQNSAERLYMDVRQRFETTRLITDATVPDLQVLDRASPPNRPLSDPRLKLLGIGIALGLGLGIGLAILLDMVDPRLRYAEQVTRGMGLAVVGAVPSVAKPQRRRFLPAPESGKLVIEALRAVRLGLSHAHGSARPLMVTISSPGSGDGKTFITSNLGLTFASAGSSVLLIDGDTRRGDLHRLFDTTRKPGLTDYLAGTVDVDEVIRNTKYDDVDVISSGSRGDRSPELLSSPRMGELLQHIKTRYDVILIDSPPLGAGVDPLLLGTLSGSLLLVVRTGNTERAMAQQKLEMLHRLPIRLLGAVLNGFDATEGYRYYSYMPGYETNEEADADKLLHPAGR